MDNQRLAEKFGYASMTILAFGVGMLLGARYCQHPDATQNEQNTTIAAKNNKTTKTECPEPKVIEKTIPKIIYECPPSPEPPKTKPGKGVKPKKVKKKVDLPDADPDIDPLERKRLLAWVREQSSDLKRCRDNSKEVYRVAVILHLHPQKKTIKRVDINADRAKVSGGLVSCLKREILVWRPPKSLVQQRNKLVFGLNI